MFVIKRGASEMSFPAYDFNAIEFLANGTTTITRSESGVAVTGTLNRGEDIADSFTGYSPQGEFFIRFSSLKRVVLR
jgi:hypothetical protein